LELATKLVALPRSHAVLGDRRPVDLLADGRVAEVISAI
jgi:hypothetical protein